MRYIVTIVLIISMYGIGAAEEIVVAKDGKQILLKDNYTWEQIKSSGTSEIKYSEDAVTIWDKALLRTDGDYSKRLGLFLHYQNNTDKKIIGVIVKVDISNPFGKSVFNTSYEDEIVLAPNERMKNDKFWTFEDNPFINDEPYDRMWQMADNGTAKIDTHVLKVIFDDGSTRGPKPLVGLRSKNVNKK